MTCILGKDVYYDREAEESVNQDYHIHGVGVGIEFRSGNKSVCKAGIVYGALSSHRV